MGVTTLRWLATSTSANERSLADENVDLLAFDGEEDDVIDDEDEDDDDDDDDMLEDEDGDSEDVEVGVILNEYEEEIGHLFEDGICVSHSDEEPFDVTDELDEDAEEPQDEWGEFVCYDFDEIPSAYFLAAPPVLVSIASPPLSYYRAV